jgi:hypothetical protein
MFKCLKSFWDVTPYSLEDGYPYTSLHDITSWGNIICYHCENFRFHVYLQYHGLLYFLYNYKDAQAMVNGKVATVPKHHAMKVYRHVQHMNTEERLWKSNLQSLSNILPNSKRSPLKNINLEKWNTRSFLIVSLFWYLWNHYVNIYRNKENMNTIK